MEYNLSDPEDDMFENKLIKTAEPNKEEYLIY